jgi:predicted lipoprotein with Yx(FWY)xxD motif
MGLSLTALTLAACGGSHSVSTATDSVVTAGKLPVYTHTRTVDGRTETLYIHPHHAVSAATTRHIVTGQVGRFGIVLLDGEREPLYAFVPDPGRSSTCSGACAAAWPPLRITIEGTLDSSPALDESLVGTEPDPEHHAAGNRVAMFAGRVVHTHVGDSPGRATGQGQHSYGGHWFLISRSGTLVTGP